MSVFLIVALITPLVAALMIAAMSDAGREPVRGVALCAVLLVLVFAAVLVYQAPAHKAGDDLRDDGIIASVDAPWLGEETGVELRFSLGLDGLSLWLFALSALLMVTAVLVSWEAIKERAAGFYASLLILETGLLGVFAARDIVLFYVFFEFTLVPLFFLIGIWGSEERRYAAMKFFLYTFAGSILTFLGLLAIVLWAGERIGVSSSLTHMEGNADKPALTFSIDKLQGNVDELLSDEDVRASDLALQKWIFLALFIGFAIKVPLFPLHTWLPLAHVQAPTAGSVILAGVLLKIGTYGFVRFCLPMLPDASAAFMPWLLWLAVGGIVYGALVALAQSDIKRLIAYSSVSHLGFCMLGIFAANTLALDGGVLQMVNHGLSTGALFAIVGMMYERYHTRRIADLGGLAKRTPILAFFFLLFTFSSIGLPGLNGFAGEFLLLQGMFERAWQGGGVITGQLIWITVLAVSGVVLGAWYMLFLVQRTFFGPLREPERDGGPPVKDMNLREIAALLPLAVFVFWIGLQPGYFVDRMNSTLDPIGRQAELRADEVWRPTGE